MRAAARSLRVAALLSALASPIGIVYLGVAPPVVALVSVIGLLTIAYRAMRQNIAPILLVFLAVLFVTSSLERPLPKVSGQAGDDAEARALAGVWRAQGGFDERLPIVLHLIFDELVSPGALDDADAVQHRFYEFGHRFGFRTFDSIYSQNYFSGVSIPHVIDAGFAEREMKPADWEMQDEVTRSAYFDAMAQRGYRTAVFQSAVLDFCGVPAVRFCETFDSFDPSSAAGEHLEVMTRRLGLWSALLRAIEPSYVSRYGLDLLRRKYGLDTQGVGVLGTADRFDVQGFTSWFDRFTSFVTRVPRGSHVFAHFMAPHSPYLLTAGCIVSGTFDAGYYLGERYASDEARAAARERNYAAYLNQVTCVQEKLAQLMMALEHLDAFRDAVIIIHGDHGSRISVGNLVEDYTTRDYIDNYATYFALRAPGVTPGIDCSFAALTEVFRSAIAAGGRLTDGRRLPVVVNSRAGADVTIFAEMPVFGCAAR